MNKRSTVYHCEARSDEAVSAIVRNEWGIASPSARYDEGDTMCQDMNEMLN